METIERRLQKRMHISLYALLFLTALLGISILLEGCTDKCETTNHMVYYEPVYTSFESIRDSTELIEPQVIHSVGKIYIKGTTLFVNEPGKGIHIIDNTNPSQPVVKNFLRIPGNYDLAVKGNILYADSYVDLVAFDISNTATINEVNRLTKVFDYFNVDFGFVAAEEGIITGWKERTEISVTESDCNFQNNYGVMCYANGIVAKDRAMFSESLAFAPGTGSGPGVGGSMAKFTIANNYLYTLNTGNLQPFDITDAINPVAKDRKYISWDIETIFPYGQNLFLGASSGMHIISIATPENPSVISQYQHVTSCDPVVVDEKYAYVTLRSGTQCQGFTNQLEVINIEDLTNPQLLKVYPMTNPHGLGIDDKTLFVCDGNDGLKIFDATDVMTIDQNMLAHYQAINAYDVIPFQDKLIMIGQDGIFQYDYSDKTDIKLLSQLAIINGN